MPAKPLRIVFSNRLLASVLIAASLIAMIPGAISFGIQYWLSEQGLADTYLLDVDFNPFTGRLRLEDLKAQQAGTPPMELRLAVLDVDWWPLAQRQAHVRALRLQGLDLALIEHDGMFSLNGIPLIAPRDRQAADTSSAAPWRFGIDTLTIRDARIGFRLPDFKQTLLIDEIILHDLHSWDAEHPAKLKLLVRLNDGLVALDLDVHSFSTTRTVGGQLRIEGLDLARLAADLKARLPEALSVEHARLFAQADIRLQLADKQFSYRQKGRISLQRPGLGLADDRLQLERLDWDGVIDWSQASGATADGALTLHNTHLTYADHAVDLDALDWKGRLAWSQATGATADGALALHNTHLTYADHAVDLDTLDWKGRLAWSQATGPIGAGSLALTGLTATAPARRLLLAKLEALEVQGLTLAEEQSIGFAQLNMARPTALAALDDKDQAPLFSASQLQLGESRARGTEALHLGHLSVQDAHLQVTLDEERTPQPLDRLQQAGSAEPKTSTAEGAAAAAAPPHLHLDGISVSGDSWIGFRDLGTAPTFSQVMTLETLTVGPVDNRSDAATPFTLKGRIGNYSDIALSGDAKPLAERLSLTLDGDVKAMDLPPLSSYTATTLGYNLQSGQLDAKLDVKIVEDQLDVQTDLTLNKLTVKPVDPEKLAELNRELSMPLDSALNMLRDGDDNIRIKLPVKGDIHSPDFDLSHVINKAMGKALKTAALTYVKYALQPYGALLTLVQSAGKQSQQAMLKPIPFEADDSTLGSDNLPYLGKLAGLLQERPKMRVTLCGLATETDRQAKLASAEAARQRLLRQNGTAEPPPPAQVSNEQLLALAKQRAETVKRSLVELGVAPERLFLCNPEIDPAADAAPRADLLL